MMYARPSIRVRDGLLFVREGTLMSQSFDATRLALAGEPVPWRNGGLFSRQGHLLGI